MSRRLVSVLVAVFAALVVLPATATATATPRSGPLPVSHHGERALDHAARVLTGATTPHPARIDATLALRDLFVARLSLAEASDVRRARHLLARPTDGSRDPYGDGYTGPATSRCSRHVCLHWVTSGQDAATSAWVGTTLRTMEQVWHHHVRVLGYRRPPADGRHGGNAKFDVYLKELGSEGLYGYCAPEHRVTHRPRAASSFCVLDNDFARSQFHRAPLEALRVTAAHEFFHAIQFGYDFHEDPWLLEATATWMEERFAGSVNDNRMYLPYGQVGIPSAPLDTFDNTGFNQYGNWAFFEYLSEHYGNGIVRQIWQHLGDGRHAKAYSIQGVRQVLARHGGLPQVLAAYAGGNTVPARTYAEGSAFPSTQIATSRRIGAQSPRWAYATHVDHLASKSVRLVPDSTLGARSQLRLRVNAPGAVTSPAAYVVVHKAGGQVVRRAIALNRSGFGSVTMAFSSARTTSATLTLTNASTRYRCHRHTTFSCQGTPRDNGERFTLSALASRG